MQLVATEPEGRWRLLVLVGLGELLAMSPWFSASAVAPLIAEQLSLSGLDLPRLTIAVQLGFVAGALLVSATAVPAGVPAAPRPRGPRHRATMTRDRRANAGSAPGDRRWRTASTWVCRATATLTPLRNYPLRKMRTAEPMRTSPSTTLRIGDGTMPTRRPPASAPTTEPTPIGATVPVSEPRSA